MLHPKKRGAFLRIAALLLSAALTLSCFSSCKKNGGETPPSGPMPSGYAPSPSELVDMQLEETKRLIAKYSVSASLSLDALLPKVAHDDFLFGNVCFSLLKDNASLANLPRRMDYLPVIFERYGTTPIRTMGSYVYAVYETDGGARAYLYFLREDEYAHMSGRVILMCRGLMQSDFAGVRMGDTMDDIAKIDPNAAIYAQCYDNVNADALKNPGSRGWQVVTTHLLRNGILRYFYELEENTEPRRYVVRDVVFSPDFTLTELNDTQFRYEILPQDFMP